MSFYVGQKVVCVDDAFDWAKHGYGDEVHPIKDQIYTIRELVTSQFWRLGEPCLILEEIRNPVRLYRRRDGGTGPYEQAFLVARFRPIVERKYDISVFKKMLAPKSRNRVHAD